MTPSSVLGGPLRVAVVGVGDLSIVTIAAILEKNNKGRRNVGEGRGEEKGRTCMQVPLVGLYSEGHQKHPEVGACIAHVLP